MARKYLIYTCFSFIAVGALGIINLLSDRYYMDTGAFFLLILMVAGGVVGYIYLKSDEKILDEYVPTPEQTVTTTTETQNQPATRSSYVGEAGINIINGKIWNQKGHILTCGYARAGKGTSILLPALLDNTLHHNDAPSFIVLDPKGENLAVAGAHLKRAGYNVHSINPFGIPHISNFGSAKFNPLSLLNPQDPNFGKYVDLIRYSIVPKEPHRHSNSFFGEAAGDLISLYTSHLMTQNKEPKTIRTLYRWLRLNGEKRFDLLNEMELNTYGDIAIDAEAVKQQLIDGGKSITDVYANVTSDTNAFKDEAIRQSMDSSDFHISEIPKNKTAVFICLEPQDLIRLSPYTRMLMACFMREIPRYHNKNRKVVMLMDEFNTFGHLKEFEDGMGFLAQYMTLWPVVQDLNQLKGNYPASWETFVGNAAVKHWMVRDNFTAEYLSKRMPMDIKFLGKNADNSPKYDRVPLMTPYDIVNCNDILMEVDGIEGFLRMPKMPYWTQSNNASPNPFY
jgi:type IV secretion system protein VirD4